MLSASLTETDTTLLRFSNAMAVKWTCDQKIATLDYHRSASILVFYKNLEEYPTCRVLPSSLLVLKTETVTSKEPLNSVNSVKFI